MDKCKYFWINNKLLFESLSIWCYFFSLRKLHPDTVQYCWTKLETTFTVTKSSLLARIKYSSSGTSIQATKAGISITMVLLWLTSHQLHSLRLNKCLEEIDKHQRKNLIESSNANECFHFFIRLFGRNVIPIQKLRHVAMSVFSFELLMTDEIYFFFFFKFIRMPSKLKKILNIT